MKATLTALLLLLIYYSSAAQILKKEYRDEADIPLSSRMFNELYSKRISYIITGDRNLSTLGTYAAVNVTKPTASVGFAKAFFVKDTSKDLYSTSVYKKRIHSALSLSAAGGFNENSVSVFSNTKLNKSAELKANYSYIPFSGRTLWKNITPADVAATKKRKALINQYFASKEFERDSKELKAKIDRKSLIASHPVAVPPGGDTVAVILKDSLVSLTDRAKLSQANYDVELAKADIAKKDMRMRALDNIKRDSMKNIFESLEVASMRFGWFDFFGTVRYQRYYTYESTVNFTQQLLKENLVHYRFGVAFNYFLDSRFINYKRFFRIEYSFGKTNNTDQLQTSVVNTIQQTNNSAISQNFRQLQDQVSAYTFSEYRSYLASNIKLDYVKPVSSKSGFSYHLYYNAVIPYESNYTDYHGNVLPIYTVQDAGLGLIFSINEKDKAKALVNIEPYFTLKDIFNKYNQKVDGVPLTIFQRNDVGIRVAVPFGNLASNFSDK